MDFTASSVHGTISITCITIICGTETVNLHLVGSFVPSSANWLMLAAPSQYQIRRQSFNSHSTPAAVSFLLTNVPKNTPARSARIITFFPVSSMLLYFNWVKHYFLPITFKNFPFSRSPVSLLRAITQYNGSFILHTVYVPVRTISLQSSSSAPVPSGCASCPCGCSRSSWPVLFLSWPHDAPATRCCMRFLHSPKS